MDIQNVLLVDDEPNIRLIAQTSLQALTDWTVTLAENGQEALASASARKPDLILLDMMMPDMDGPTTLSQLRKIETLKDVPVIFMTAKVQSHELDEYVNMSAAGVISKPFNPMTLHEDVLKIVAVL
jgi:two-component system OmpR family response regulator